MNKIFLKLVGIALVIGFIVSCYYDSEEAINPVLSTVCDTVNVTYSKNIKSILSENCISCHSGSSAKGGIALNDYTSAKANADVAIKAIKNGSMPPSGKLNDCAIIQYEKWISANKPQ